jgi:predicted RNase H-like nuclease (RuvC/YqgF family)
MKLEELLKDFPETWKVVQDAINKVNEGQEDKLKHVRFADLSEGGYVARAKYEDLDAENQTNASKLTEANKLIDQLKKAAKGDENLQGQITGYQTKIQSLEQELTQTKIDSAIKVGLLAENAVDIDYLTYKLKEKGEQIELDEQGNIKGWEDKVSALKTQIPSMFTGKSKGGFDGFKPLEKDDEIDNPPAEPKSLAEALKQRFENPDNE